MSYIPQIIIIPTETEGNKTKLSAQDEEVLQINQDMLGELKKLNLHFSLLNDVHLEDADFND